MLSGHLRTFKDIHVRTLEDLWPESWGDGILGESLQQERRNCWTATHTEQIQKHLHPPFLIGQKNLFLANQKWVRVRTRKCRRFEVLFLGHWGRPHESFKAIHNLGPAYLSDLINIRRCSSYNLLCNVGVFLHDPSAKFKRTLGDRSFTAAVPKIWNVLPNYIRKQSYENKKISGWG